ncbi:MAG: exonuclease domain-containing protein [Balneolales bacterium]
MEVAILDRNKVLFTWNQTSSNASDENLKNELPKILKNLKSGVVVGHNVCFDLNFIAYKAGKFGHTGPNVFFIDTLNLSRRLIETVSSYKLEFLLQYFNISIHGELHTALVDAQATQALFWKLIERGEIGTLKEVGMKKLNWSFF